MRLRVWRANRPCYTPRPIAPTGIGAGSGRAGAAHVGTSCAHHDRGSARPRAAARAAGDRPRARVEGPAAAVGPCVPPDVLVPRELPGRPDPRLHRPLFAAGRRRPRPVLRPRHDAAPGLRRGPDRRRQRPQPVRPPADRGQGRARDARPGDDPPRPAAAGLEREFADWLALGERGRRPDPRIRPRWCRPPGSRTPASDGVEPVPVEVALAFHPRTLGQLLFVRTTLRLDDRTDRFLAAALTGILHGKSASYLSELMPNTFSMAPRYVRDFAARTAFSLARPRRLRRARQEARPALPPGAAVDRGDRPARRCARRGAARPGGAARPRPPGPRPPRRHLAALPAGRQVRLLQLAADVVPRLRRPGDRRDPRRRPPPRAVSRVPARRPRRPAPGPRRRRRRRPRHRRRRDRPRPLDPRRGRPGRACLGGRRGARGLPPGRGRARRRRRGPEDDQAVGRRGGPGDQDRPDPRPRRDRGGPPAGPRRRAARRRLDLAAEGVCAPSRMPPCSRCTTRRTWPRWIRWS